MKLTFFFLLACCLQLSARISAQQLTLHLEAVPVQQVFSEIFRQTAFSVIYDEEDIRQIPLVSINVENVPLQEVLELCLPKNKFRYQIENSSVMLLPAKDVALHKSVLLSFLTESIIPIHGRITDSAGNALQGANVTIKGSKKAAITDQNGEFSLSDISHNATLVISFVGFSTQEIGIHGRNEVNIRLIPASAKLEQVEVYVNNGYQQVPKERATGSFTHLDNETLNQQVGLDIISRLKGVAPGVLFDDSKVKIYGKKQRGFTIRGLSTINGNQDPLIVVDNFPFEGDLNNINPNDVESVTILKDAAAASIWGSRAGNGVVVITTKKGQLNQPLSLNFNNNVLISTPPNILGIDQISSSEYIKVERMLFDAGYYDYYLTNPYHSAVTPVVDLLNKMRNNLIDSGSAEASLRSLAAVDTRRSYKDAFLSNGINQQYSLNLHGGSANNSYYISGGLDRGRTVLNEYSERLSIRMNNDLKVLNNLQAKISIGYSNFQTRSGHIPLTDLLVSGRQVPYIQLKGPDGRALPFAKYHSQSYADTAGDGRLLDWNYYPLTDDQHSTHRLLQNELTGNFSLEYKLFNGLYIESRYSFEQQWQQDRYVDDMQSYAARNVINTFSEINATTGEVTYHVPKGSTLRRLQTSTHADNIREQANLNKAWGKSELIALGGFEIRQIKTDNQDDGITYGFDEDLYTSGSVDIVNPYISYVSGYPSYIPGGVLFSLTTNRYVSAFANAAYTYNNKYTITASVRRDGSNLFGVRTNDKWKPLWSSGIAWNISQERFYKSGLLPSLKVRAAYGYSGSTDPTQTAVTVMYYAGQYTPTGLTYGQIQQFANPDLRPEKVGMFNVGIDFTSRNNIFSGSLEGYYKKGVDLLGPSPVDNTTGIGAYAPLKNIASMSAKGIDLNVTSRNIRGAFQWQTGLLVSCYTDKTLNYYYPGSFPYFPKSGESISALKGRSLHGISSYRWAGLEHETGDPLGYLNHTVSKDYYGIYQSITTPDSLVYEGSASPKWFGNITNTFSFKGFSILVNISFKLGYYFRRPVTDYDGLFDNGIGYSDVDKRWRKPGDELITNAPSLYYPLPSFRGSFYYYSDITVSRADHIRLQYINLTYDFNKLLKGRGWLKDFQLYANASNLGILWRSNKQGYDPEYPTSAEPPRNYAAGIRTSF